MFYSTITNSEGVASFAYTGVGRGDISITATVNGLSDEILIEDDVWWDDASTDKSTSYTIYANGNPSFTHETDYYDINHPNNTITNIILPITPLSYPFVFEFDYCYYYLTSSTKYKENGVIIADGFDESSNPVNGLELQSYNKKIGFGKVVNGNWSDVSRIDYTLPSNKWCKFRVTVYPNTVKGEIIDLTNNTVLYNNTIPYNCLTNEQWMYGVMFREKGVNAKLKNIKLKNITSSS